MASFNKFNAFVEDLAEKSKAMGYTSIELLNPPEVLTIKKMGMTCAVLNGGKSVNIANCLNRTENHDAIEKMGIDPKGKVAWASDGEQPDALLHQKLREASGT